MSSLAPFIVTITVGHTEQVIPPRGRKPRPQARETDRRTHHGCCLARTRAIVVLVGQRTTPKGAPR